MGGAMSDCSHDDSSTLPVHTTNKYTNGSYTESNTNNVNKDNINDENQALIMSSNQIQFGGRGMSRPPSSSSSIAYTKNKISILYPIATTYVTLCTIVCILQPFIIDCDQDTSANDFENPGYAFAQECHDQRYIQLLFLTPLECSFGRRIVASTIFGALIGFERRKADRISGIGIMVLVSLSACLFTICSAFAFLQGPMGWDASRISAAIPSGVGFLGAGIIWKQYTSNNHHFVHGLTTGASLWLSAAVGIACSGELYYAASLTIAVALIILRFGPKTPPSLTDDMEESIRY